MKLLCSIIGLLLSNLILGQGATSADTIKETKTITCTQPKGSTVCEHKGNAKFSSCAYFYPGPSEELKAKGKQNLDHQKIGKWTYYHQNGKRAGIAFFTKDGEKTGTWKYYNSMGSGGVSKVVRIKKGGFGISSNETKIPLEEIEEPVGFVD